MRKPSQECSVMYLKCVKCVLSMDGFSIGVPRGTSAKGSVESSETPRLLLQSRYFGLIIGNTLNEINYLKK